MNVFLYDKDVWNVKIILYIIFLGKYDNFFFRL